MFYKLNQLIKALTKRERAVFLTSTAVFTIAVAVFGVYLFTAKTVEAPAHGGVWKEGIVGQPVFINPVISNTDADQDISRLIFAPLSDLTESIKSDETGREWTVRLKDNLKWQDGEKITTDDILFTFDTITNTQTNSYLASSFEGASIQRVSELEVKFTLPSSYVFFNTTLKNLRPIPKHIFEDIPPANFYLSSYVKEPIGSGPYVYKSVSKEKDGFIDEYVLESNRNYFGNRPYIQKFVFRFYKDEAEAVTAYNRGEINGFATSNPMVVSNIKTARVIHTISAPRYYAVFFNPALNPYFKDKKTRQTLSAAISREEIVKSVFNGMAEPAYGPLPSVETPIPDKSNLDLVDRQSFTLTVPDIDLLVRMAEIIKSDWEKLGVSVTVKPVKTSEVQEIIKNRSYEAVLFGNILNEPQDLFSFWHSSKRFYPGLNLAFFNNLEVDRLLDSIRTEPDENRRLEELSQASRTISDESAAAFVVFPEYIYITTPNLKGFETDSGIILSDRLNDVTSWYVSSVRKFK